LQRKQLSCFFLPKADHYAQTYTGRSIIVVGIL